MGSLLVTGLHLPLVERQPHMKSDEPVIEHVPVSVPAADVVLHGDLSMPSTRKGVVLFAHGSGSSRHSPRNRYVAEVLNEHSLGTLLVDLLTAEEECEDQFTGHLRFNIELLTRRLVAITDWLALRLRFAGTGLACSAQARERRQRL